MHTTTNNDHHETGRADDFERQANEASIGLVAEFFHFLLNSKKWWLTPILLVLVLLGLFTVLASSGAAPFIYTLF